MHNKNIQRYFEYFSEGQKTEGSDAEAAASGDGMNEMLRATRPPDLSDVPCLVHNRLFVFLSARSAILQSISSSRPTTRRRPLGSRPVPLPAATSRPCLVLYLLEPLVLRVPLQLALLVTAVAAVPRAGARPGARRPLLVLLLLLALLVLQIESNRI